MCMRFSYKEILILFFVFVGLNRVISQITTTNAPPYDTEEYLVNDVLLGADLTTSNFLSQGFAQGIGYFDGTNANIGFEEGVILSTGGLDFVTGGFGGGSGISGEADLELALNQINLFWDVNNVTVLEFDFIAESESVTFNYVFGSQEYTSYTCSVFNDIFGFFLSGPGINGIYSDNAINLARIPDPEGFNDYQTWLDNNTGLYTNTPVAVNTVNSGEPSGFGGSAQCDEIDPNWGSYNIFWIDNDYAFGPYQGPNPPPAPEGTVQGLTGFTVPLQATYNGLICGETYHIKLAIADASDTALNSVVFLEANSFSSPAVEVSSFNSEAELSGNSVLEGCGDLNLQFIRSGDMSMDLDLSLSYSGDAVMGVDYENLPDQIVIPANQEVGGHEFDEDNVEFYGGDREVLAVKSQSIEEGAQLQNEVQEIEISSAKTDNKKTKFTNVTNTSRAPKPVGAYPHSRRVGDLLFLSGVGPRQPGTDAIPGGATRDRDGNPQDYDVEAQTRAVIENIKIILEDSGSSLDKVIDVQAFLIDMDRDFKGYNKVYAEYFTDIQATRTTIAIRALPTPIAVEFKVTAMAGEPS